MTYYIKPLIIVSIVLLSCKEQQGDLKKLCAEIRNTPETESPKKTNDKKFRLIQQLKRFNSDEACDSLKAIFLTLKSWDYVYEPLYILSEHNSKKSLLVLSEIIRDYPLDNPGNMFFIWDLVIKTENISVMFPNLTKSLGIQEWTDGNILMMIINANQKGHLTKEQLLNSKEDLIKFYTYLKIEKDSLSGSKHYDGYYEAHLTDLLLCLRIFEPEEAINLIYKDVLKLNSSYEKFCSVGLADYNNNSIIKITALFQAVLGLLQNDQSVDEKYLELIAAEPLYHNDFYSELQKLNKQSFFPKEYLSQEFFAISDLAFSKENTRDDGLPDCLEFLDKREIKQGVNKGMFYFYNSKYYDNSMNEIILEVSGPQPAELTEFVVKARKTNKIYTERFNRDKVSSKIDEIIKKLED